MEELIHLLSDLTRCAQAGRSAATRLLSPSEYQTADTDVQSALEAYHISGCAQENLLSAAEATAKALFANAAPMKVTDAFAPLPSRPFWTPASLTFRQTEAIREILRGHKSPDGLDGMIEDGSALLPALLTDWLNALSRGALRERAVRALCAMGQAVYPAVSARRTFDNAPADRALLCVLLAISNQTEFLQWLPEAENMLSNQDMTALTAVIPFLVHRAENIPVHTPAGGALYRFFAKLLPLLICRPGSHVFLVGACLDALAAFEVPQAAEFMEEMLKLCEHQMLKESC